MKNIVYVASCLDLATGEKLQSSKIGIATSDADKRIRALNSTKQPFAVELDAAWSFEHSGLDAADIEAALHALLEPDRVNGEWFRDADGDLADRVGKAVARLGGVPVGDDNVELAEMNERQKNARARMEAAFEPIRSELDALNISWEYMTWMVGVDSGIGRIVVKVTKKSGLYVRKGRSRYTADFLKEKTGLDWREGDKQTRVMCSNLTSQQLLDFLRIAQSFSEQDQIDYSDDEYD